ncbi:outer membrane murein-binding lipoprotein Lpp [Mesorhizobium sp. URHB0026]
MAHQTRALTFSGPYPRLSCLCVLLLTGVLAGCSSSDQIKQQSQTVASAAQTVSMVLDAWMDGAAPFAYTSGTLRSTGKTLADAEAQIRSAGTAEPAEQSALAAAVKDLSAAVARAEAGLQADSRAEVQNARQDLLQGSRTLATAYARYFAPKP